MELVGGGLYMTKNRAQLCFQPPLMELGIVLFHSCGCKDLSVADLLKSDGSKAAVKRLSELEARSKLLVVELSVENVDSAHAKQIVLFHSCGCKDLSVADLLKSDGSKAAVKRLSELEARSKLLVVELSVENVDSAHAKQVNLLKLLACAKQVMTVPSTGRSLRDLVMSTRWLW
ncbi:hypothetical protein F2Q69_00007348 [Brassica cretica]|uniref:Uncharacterized protein n=1 Tax=Brassica cretica TaxID=69181 RepID=A0A8S9NXU3_BRACR|nr:hypothetical protein F2Q69_00007348 [Brassica cretica]